MSDNPTIISASDAMLKNIYAQNLPILLYLHSTQTIPNAALLDAFNKLLKKHGDQMLIVTLNTDDNPTTAAKYQHQLPALVTMEHKLFGIREHAQAEDVRIADVRAYAAYLLGQGEDPALAKQREAQKSQKPTPAGTSDVTDSTFKKQVFKSDTPVLVDFWAPWCGPCQQVSPMLEQLGREYQGKIRVVKVNVDENPALSRKYNIQSIPAMMIFKGGAIVQTTHGAQPKHIIEKMIRNSLG